ASTHTPQRSPTEPSEGCTRYVDTSPRVCFEPVSHEAAHRIGTNIFKRQFAERWFDPMLQNRCIRTAGRRLDALVVDILRPFRTEEIFKRPFLVITHWPTVSLVDLVRRSERIFSVAFLLEQSFRVSLFSCQEPSDFRIRYRRMNAVPYSYFR